MPKKLSDLSFRVNSGEEMMDESKFQDKLYNVMESFMKVLGNEMNGLTPIDSIAFYMNVSEIIAKNSIITLQNVSGANINDITEEFCAAIRERIDERETKDNHFYDIGLQ